MPTLQLHQSDCCVFHHSIWHSQSCILVSMVPLKHVALSTGKVCFIYVQDAIAQQLMRQCTTVCRVQATVQQPVWRLSGADSDMQKLSLPKICCTFLSSGNDLVLGLGCPSKASIIVACGAYCARDDTFHIVHAWIDWASLLDKPHHL